MSAATRTHRLPRVPKGDAWRLAVAAGFCVALLLSAWGMERWDPHSLIALLAQTAETIALIVALWLPWGGFLLALLPMSLSLSFGYLQADVFLQVVLPAVFVAAKPWAAATTVVGALVGYGVAHGVLWRDTPFVPDNLGLIALGVLIGLVLRAIRLRQQRARGLLEVLATDVENVRSRERAQLGAELRHLVLHRLNAMGAQLQSGERLASTGAMQRLIRDVSATCSEALADVRGLVGLLRQDEHSDGAEDAIAHSGTHSLLEALRGRLEARGVAVLMAVDADLTSYSSVVQTTVIRACEKAEALVRAADDAHPTYALRIQERRGRLAVDLLFSAPPPTGPGEADDESRPTQRVRSLGGTLEVGSEGQQRHWRVTLPVGVLQRDLQVGPPATGGRAARRPDLARLARVLVSVVAGAWAAGTLIVSLSETDPAARLLWTLDTLALGVVAVTPWFPILGALLALAPSVGLMLVEGSHTAVLVVVAAVVAWSLAWVPSRRVGLAMAGLVTIVFGSLVVSGSVGPASWAVVFLTVWLTLPAALGVRHVVSTRRRHAEQVAAAAETMRRVSAEERATLARELHDVVAHHLSLITLQDMGYRDSEDPAELRQALRRMSDACGRARDEMELLGRVMTSSGETADTGLLSPLSAAGGLAETLRDHGFQVEVNVPPGIEALPPTAQRTLTRAMQEAVTNVLRYARPASRCSLSVTVDDSTVRLRVASRLPSRARASGLSLGYGLVGIRERVDLSRGRFSAGPVGDEWVVTAELPLQAYAA